MARSNDDIKYGTAQAKLSEDEALRKVYKHGAPLEAGKIADSEPVDLLSTAHNIQKSTHHHRQDRDHDQDRDRDRDQDRDRDRDQDRDDESPQSNTGRYPSKTPPSLATK